jgi:hypothetical protein
MAKTFLTNINLKGNQLLNAVIHSASSAPAALAAGQLYFNTGNSTFYYSTGTGTGNWSPVGVQYISSVGSNLSVTGGELDISTDPSFNTIHLTQDGDGENILVGNDAYIGDINVSNFIGIKGNGDATKGGIKFGSAKTEDISTDGSNLTLTSSNDIILLPDGISGHAYVGPSSNAGNRIATISDITTDLTGYVTETGVETLTNKTISDKLNFVGYTSPTDGYIWANTSTGAIEVNAEYDIQLSPGGIVNIGSGSGELHLQKTEYWRNGTQQGVIAAQSDNSLRLTAVDGQLQLESNSGDVRINPSSTVTWFNSNLNIDGDGGVISTDNNSLHLNADNGVITTDTAEFHTTKTEYWHGGDTSGTRLGIIVAHPSDGSLSIAASNQLVLESHSGDINLYPDGHAYVGGSSDGNRIATISDIHTAAQGLSVLTPVIAAAGINIDITVPVSTLIGGVELANGNRVLLNAQSTTTENGIYIFSGSTNMLELSTNQEDVALKEGSYTLVTEGTYAAQGYIVTSVPYTSATIWTQFSAAGEYTAGSGIAISGASISFRPSDVISGSTYIVNPSGVVLDLNLSALESQLVSDDFAKNADYTTVTRKYSSSITGNNTDDTFSFTHALGSRDVMVRVYQTSAGADQYNDVEVDIKRTSINTIGIYFATPPAIGETYSVVVIG